MLRALTSQPRLSRNSTTTTTSVAATSAMAVTNSSSSFSTTSATSWISKQQQQQPVVSNSNSSSSSFSSGGLLLPDSSSLPPLLPTVWTSMRFQSSSNNNNNNNNNSNNSSSSSSGLRAADLKDEEELVRVLGSHPKHVARRVRQMMAASRRRLSHFRNTVTYLMIVLQGKLQKNEIAPKDAAVVVEGILQECVDLGQSDMAHLLFRAALRFRKYGVPVSPKCVHALYGSFRESNFQRRGTSTTTTTGGDDSSSSVAAAGGGGGGNDSRRGLLAQLALEMKNEEDLKALTIAAYIYAGQLAEAQKLHNSIPSSQLSPDDFCTMIQAYANIKQFSEVEELVTEASKISAENFDHALVYSAAICHCSPNFFQLQQNQQQKNNHSSNNRGSGGGKEAVALNSQAMRLQESFLSECLENACQPTDLAVAAIMRSRLSKARSLEDAATVESDLRSQLKTDQLGMPATTAFVLRCADFMQQGHRHSDDTMATKIDQLAQIVDTCIEAGQVDQLDHNYAIALVRGFGALGQFDKMGEMLRKLKEHTVLVDFKVYDEALRWLSYSGNVKWMLQIKEEMEKDHIYHTTWTYVGLLRGLGRFYPRLTHKYIEEARKTLPYFDERMYSQVLNSYGVLGDMEGIRQIYAEMLDRDARGRRPFSVHSVSQLLFNLAQVSNNNHNNSSSSGNNNNNNNSGVEDSNNNNNTAAADGSKLFDEVVALANRRGLFNSELIQRAVISGYATQKRTAELHHFVAQLPRKSFQIYMSLLTAYGKLDDTNGFDKLLQEMKAASIPFNDSFFSIAAEICAKWRDNKRFKQVVEISKGAVISSTSSASSSSSRRTAMSSTSSSSSSNKDPRTISRLAHAHAMMGDWDAVTALWKEIKDGDESNKNIPMAVFNRFLEMCVRRNDLGLAHDVLEVMMARVPPNPVTTTTVMDMLARMGRLHEVEVLLDEMCRTKNVQPTLVTFHHAMTAFAKVGDVAKLVALRERLRAIGLTENHVTHNILLSGYGRAQRFESIPELLNERAAYNIPMDTNCYEILLDIYAKARLANELENTVQALLRRSALVDSNESGGGGGGGGRSNPAQQHDLQENSKNNQQPGQLGASPESPLTPRLLAAIATAYSHLGDVANVEKFVNLLLAHRRCRQSHIETTFLIYHRLRDNSKLDSLLAKYGGSEFILNICISAFAKAGMHDRVASILEELQRKKFALHTNTAVVLSSLLLKAGKVELAQTVLKFRRVSGASDLRRQQQHEHESIDLSSATSSASPSSSSSSSAAAAAVDDDESSSTTTEAAVAVTSSSTSPPTEAAEAEVFGK